MGTDETNLPIDKGWAWVIVLASSGLYLLAYGGFKTQGIILIEVTERFEGTSDATNLWLFSANFITCTLLGPLTSFLITRFGHRIVSMLGVLFLTLSHIGLALTPSRNFAFLLYSFPAGIGNSCLILTALLVSNQYFKEKKAFALGLISGGSGLGSVVIAQWLRFIFDEFDYRSALILHAAFVVQFLALAALLRPIEYYMRGPRKPLADMEHSAEVPGAKQHSSNLELGLKTQNIPKQNDVHCSDPSGLIAEKRNVAEFTRSLRMLSDGPVAGSMLLLNTSTQLLSGESIHHEPVINSQSSTKPKVVLFNWRLLFVPKMIMVGISIFSFCLATSILYQSIPALGKESGISKNVIAIALMCGGAVEIFARTGQGFFADRKLTQAVTQLLACMLFTGVSVILCAIFSGLPGVISALVGMSVAGTSIFNLIPVVLSEVLGNDQVASAMGVQFLYQALAFIVSTSVAGVIYNSAGSWQAVFYFMGAGMLTGGTFLTPYMMYRFCQRTEERNSKITEMLE